MVGEVVGEQTTEARGSERNYSGGKDWELISSHLHSLDSFEVYLLLLHFPPVCECFLCERHMRCSNLGSAAKDVLRVFRRSISLASFACIARGISSLHFFQYLVLTLEVWKRTAGKDYLDVRRAIWLD